MSKRILALFGTVILSLMALSSLVRLMSSSVSVARADPVCPQITSDIMTDTTWAGECYRVMSTTVIQRDVALTISPPVTGTRVEFMAGAQLQAFGYLYALGTSSRPITFTSASAAPGPDAWLGIELEAESGGDVIRYSVVEYARTGIRINNVKDLQIMSNTFRYNGDGTSLDGAISGITDRSNISYNRIYSNTNGIVLGKSYSNTLAANLIYNILRYGLAFTEQPGIPGGDDNQVIGNEIHACAVGLRLENGSDNKVFENMFYLNPDGAIHLSGQRSASVRYNYVYSNEGGSGYQAAIYMTGTPDPAPDVAYNTIYEHNDAIEYVAPSGDTAPRITNNALCSIPAYELRNGSSVTVNAQYNWWGTNTPTAGREYTGPVSLNPWITLTLGTWAANLPADGASSTVVTITLRDSEGFTVPPPPTRQTNPPAPNPRRIELTTTLGALSPTVVVVDDHGIATATLTAAPTTDIAIIKATAFCGYAVTSTVWMSPTNVAITKTTDITQVLAGNVLTYRISYSNTSSVAAGCVVITDDLPAETAYVTDTRSLPAVAADHRITWTVGTLPPGASNSFTLAVRVSPTATCGVSLTNHITISSSTAETVITDNVAVAPTVTVTCVGADLSIDKSASPPSGPPTDPITFTITYTNNSMVTLPNVTLADVLPLCTTYYTDTSGFQHVISDNVVTWTIPSLVPNQPFSFTLHLLYKGSSCGGVTVFLPIILKNYAPRNGAKLDLRECGPGAILCNPERDLSVAHAVPSVPKSECVTLTNTINITSTTPDSDPSNNTYTATYRVCALPVVAFSSPNYYVTEGDGLATITVTLSALPVQTVTVVYSTTDGTATAWQDYTPVTGTLTFTSGIIQTFTVPITDDGVAEPDETIVLTLSNPVNATLGSPNPATLTIRDSCRPIISTTFPSKLSPMGMAYDPVTYRLFVANLSGESNNGNLTVINVSSSQTITVVTNLPGAQGVAFDAARNRIYVAGKGSLYIVDGESYGILKSIYFNEDMGAYAVAYNPTADKIYVSGSRDNTIRIVNAADWSIFPKLTHPEIREPFYIAVNPDTNKVYVSNHNDGASNGWVTVIDGNTNGISKSIPLGGDLYGIAVDTVHNWVYVASISAKRVYVIDGATDKPIGDFQVWSSTLKRYMPLRQVAVNPNAGGETHLWLTSSSRDHQGKDLLILLSGNSPITATAQKQAVPVAASPEGGLLFDPTSWYVFVSSARSNLVTVLRDSASLCMSPLSLSANNAEPERLMVIMDDYSRHNTAIPSRER